MTDHGQNDIQYEKTDIDIGAVTKIGLVILAVTVVTAAALVPIIGVLKGRAEKSDPPAAPIAGFASDRQAPEPRLQREPFGDWRTMKKQQDELLGSYGWVDEGKGITRIKIDDAMKLLVERGVPARPAPSPLPSPVAAASPVPAPAEHHP